MGFDDDNALFLPADPLEPRVPTDEYAATMYAALRHSGGLNMEQLAWAVNDADHSDDREPVLPEQLVDTLDSLVLEHRVRRTIGRDGQPRFHAI